MFRRDCDDEMEELDEKPSDFMLRQAGFTINGRPRNTEAIWSRDGKDYAESEAWALMNAEALEGKR